MPFERVPRRFLIELVNQTTILINPIPRRGGVHDVISARQLVTGKVLHVLKYKIREYVHGHIPTTNNTNKPRTTEGLYIGASNNRSRHYIFKLKTKEMISVLRVTAVTLLELVINLVDKMGREKSEVEGIEFWDIFGNITINNIELMPVREDILDDNDDVNEDSNASNEEFELNNEEVEEEAKRDGILDEVEKDINGYQELQCDYFNAKGEESDEKFEVTSANGDVSNAPDTGDTNNDDYDIFIESDDDNANKDEDLVEPDGDEVDIDNKSEEDNPSDKPKIHRIQKAVASNLGSYWGDGITGAIMEAKDSVAKLLKNDSQMSVWLGTPQYYFMKGMKIFRDAGYDATVKKLEENLINCNCITMLDKDDVTNNLKNKALGYLLFSKRKQCGKVKGQGCVDGRPQRDYITKEESTTPIVPLNAPMATYLVDALEHKK